MSCRAVQKKALPVSRVFSVYYDTHDKPGVAPPCLLWLQEQAAVLLWNMDGYQTEIVSTFFLLAHRCPEESVSAEGQSWGMISWSKSEKVRLMIR